MRVISGKAKGKKLKAVPGDSTRPITDRAKESLFNILGRWIIDASVLDLFGGTGAVGIEALSRGAAHVTFLDKDYRAVRTIRENLHLTGLAGQAQVIRTDAFRFLTDPPANQQPFDLIYIAPPQHQAMWSRAIDLIDQYPNRWLRPDSAVIAQIHPVEYQALPLRELEEYDQRKYGSTLLCFYERRVQGENV